MITQQTQNICISFAQRRANVFNVGSTLYKWYTFCLPGKSMWKDKKVEYLRKHAVEYTVFGKYSLSLNIGVWVTIYQSSLHVIFIP